MKYIFALQAVFAIAWSVNIYKLTTCDFKADYSCEILHGVGLIPIAAPVFVWFSGDDQ